MSGPLPLDALIDRRDAAWPALCDALAGAAWPVQLLPATPADADRTLLALQVSTRTLLGTVAHRTGGILVDGGWLRILGSGHPRLPGSLADWNGLGRGVRMVAGALVVAHDAVGGLFAVNAGGLPGDEGAVSYFSPELRAWEEISPSYVDFLGFALDGDLPSLANPLRWPDWEDDVAALHGDQGVLFWPPPWYGPGWDAADAERTVLPIQEVVQRVFTGAPPDRAAH